PHPWLEEERSRFASLLSAGASILDIGCGPGHDSAYFHAKGFNTLGIDISSEMICRARLEHPDCSFVVMDGLKIEDLHQSFDAVWMAYVILHIPRIEMPQMI